MQQTEEERNKDVEKDTTKEGRKKKDRNILAIGKKLLKKEVIIIICECQFVHASDDEDKAATKLLCDPRRFTA